MMKKENLILTVAFVIMLVVGIVVVTLQNFVPLTAIDKMFNQKVVIANEQAVIDPEYSQIFEKAEVKNLNGEKLANLYIARVDNTYFYLELYVAIDAKGKVYAIDKEIIPKDETSKSYLPLVREYLLKNYNGLYYPNVQYIDGAAGATTIQVSRSAIKNVVEQIIVYHNGKPIDYIEQLFGAKYTLNASNTVSGIEVSDVTVNGQNYKVYRHKLNGSYNDGFQDHEGSITILVAIDTNGVIQYVSMPKDLYGHTQGNFYQISNSYVELLKGVNVNDELPDLVAGTTDSQYSRTLISNIVEDIMEVAR